ncbi:Aste57867_8373 [Aphanomyces stellatus]|uniref:Transmembrane protein 198 n=1 Tax=Aphanomyces stellatus TaxID=120398 RepID=A0A485KK50_9STRA|nr:hypothetical protein As57867_008341 [Aphanomyces stellatus]VFT85259.1 Aste57867_8373 [Aphanomyces stellatus]
MPMVGPLLAGIWADAVILKIVMIQADALDNASLRSVILIGSLALLVVALFITFMGYKHFSTALILQGAILGGYLGWYVGGAFGTSAENADGMINLIVAVALGFFLAVITCCMKGLMRFLFGVALGVQIGSFLNIVWLHSVQSSLNQSNPNGLGYVVMASVGCVLGILAYFTGRHGHIVLTACVGAFWVVQAVGNFIGDFPSIFLPFPRDARTATVSTSYFIYMGGWALLAVLGMMAQFHLTTLESNFHDLAQDTDDELSLEKEFHKSKTPYHQDVSV